MIQSATWATLSESVRLSIHVDFLSSWQALLPISSWEFIFGRAVGALSLATGPGGGIQHAHGCSLTSISGWELKTCFKLLDITFILQRRAFHSAPPRLPDRSGPRWPGRAY